MFVGVEVDVCCFVESEVMVICLNWFVGFFGCFDFELVECDDGIVVDEFVVNECDW